MKIAEIDTFPVKGRWAFVRVRTDDGAEGWGECSLEGRARTVCTQIDELSRRLIGMEADRIEAIWQFAYRSTFYRGGPVLLSAISGIDIALWDLLGKSLGAPIHALLGGRVRDRVRVYTGLPGEMEVGDAVASIRDRRLTAFKTALTGPADILEGADFIESAAERAAALRAAAGSKIDIMFDLHGRVSPAVAVQLAEAVAPIHPLFLEEPCLPENVPALEPVARRSPVPIATGERRFGRHEFREILERGAAAVVQPDLCHCGGISETRRIGAMAEPYYVGIAPHNPLGPISTAACLQVDAVTPNFLVQEFASLGEEGILREPFRIDEDGYVPVPGGPGLGIEIDEEAVRALGFEDWDNPVFHADDGSLRDW